MLKEVVFKQKTEKERLLALPYLEREKGPEAKKWLDSNLIKVILGPRRAGKSVFALTLLKDRSFAYFNFDDEGLSEWDTFDFDSLMRELHVAYGDTKTILFDEIQNVPKWELFANRLHRGGYNLILTGSNARLLSKELATALTGRHIPLEILPFSFKEFLYAKKYVFSVENMSLPEERARLLVLLESHLVNGGYPELVVKDLDVRGYLDVLFDAILFKDVIKRHRVRSSGQIDRLGSYLINTVAGEYSLRKLVNVLDFRSGVTLEKYIQYLTEAYLVFPLSRYSVKAGERIRSPKKIYVVDNGFVSAKAVQHSPDTGKFMENLVFVELMKRGKRPNLDLFFYKTRHNREVDFVIKEGFSVSELVQVAYQVDNVDTERREMRALLEAAEELKTSKLTLVTWNEKREIKKGDTIIRVVPLVDWLLEF